MTLACILTAYLTAGTLCFAFALAACFVGGRGDTAKIKAGWKVRA